MTDPRLWRRALLSGCAAAAFISPYAFAQAPAPIGPATEDVDEIEEVLITGTRIRRSPLTAPTPLVSFGADDIDKSGLVSVGEFLQRIPQSGGTFNRLFNNSGNFGFPADGGGIGAGSVQADLRFLGPKRVLVLVDGQRWVNETSGSGVSAGIDLNTVPTNAVERIEVLQEGASAIYGSDAIAGVINIITKQDFEGFHAQAYGGGNFEEWDGTTQKYSLSYGVQGDRTRMFFDVSFTEQNEIRAIDREISSFPTPGVGACTPFCSSGTPQGRFIFVPVDDAGNPIQQRDADGNLRFDAQGDPIFTADITLNQGAVNRRGNLADFNPDMAGLNDDFNPFDTADRFNFAQFNLLATPNKRISFFSNIEHDFTENVTFELKAVFNSRESANQAAPEPLFIGPGAGGGNILDTISVDETNPFNPFGFTLSAFGPDGTLGEGNFVFAGRRPIEAGPRRFRQNVDTWYVNGGLIGEFALGERTFFWDMHAIWSESQANQRKMGAFNAAKLKQALGPIDECVSMDADGDNIDDVTGCTPFNFFGGQGPDDQGTITSEMLDFVGFIQRDESQTSLFDFNANIAGDVFRLPAGWIAFAAGFEHRERDGFFIPDAIVAAGDSAGVPAQPTSGKFNVDEVYGELVVPILGGLPFVQRLEASFAARVTDNSITDTETTIKANLNWRVTEDLLLRGGFSEGFRAPSIGEAFGSAARNDAVIDDPCSDFLGVQGGDPQPQTIIDNCIARGVPTDGSFQQLNSQISVTVGGNPDLEPETADIWNASGVYSPQWASTIPGVESLTFELTYWKIELDQAIQVIDAQVKLDGCIQTLDPLLCEGIDRRPDGTIFNFENRLTNIGGIEEDGIDLTVEYYSPIYSIGQFHVRALVSYLNSFDEIIPTSQGFETRELEGTEVGDPERGFPQWQFYTNFDWFYESVAVTFTLRGLSAIDEDCPRAFFGVPAGGISDLSSLCSDPDAGINTLEAKVYGDLQATYTLPFLDDRFALTAGINNIWATDPPECLSCALNGFDATLYDVPGRFGFLRARARF